MRHSPTSRQGWLTFATIALLLAPGLASGAETSPPTLVPVSAPAPAVRFGTLLGFSPVIGVASSASGVLLGAGLGSLSNHLLGALLPGALVANLLLPPLLTVLSLVLLGNWHAEGRFSAWLPLLGAFAVNAASYLVVGLLLPIAVAWTNPIALVLYALVDGVLMAGATTGVMALTERRVLTVRAVQPGARDLVFASLYRVEF